MTRHRLRQLLGVLWLTAAVLQAQPRLFTHSLADDVVAPAGLFQPTVVAAPVHLAARVVAAHPALCNLAVVLVEAALGVALLLASRRQATLAACGASTAWALSVWWVGEGAGGLFTGHAALSTGAPGAALVYAAIGCLAAPPRHPAAGAVPRVPHRAAAGAWAAIWTCGAVLALLPGQLSALALGDQVAMGAMMSPAPLAHAEMHLARWLVAEPAWGLALAVTLVVVIAVIAATPLLAPRAARVALLGGIVVSTVFWVVAQGFGGISTGTATDVGAAPALVLLGLAMLGTPASRVLDGAGAAQVPGADSGRLRGFARVPA